MNNLNSTFALQELTDSELWSQTKFAAQSEKQATSLLLDHLAEVESRRLFAARAFSSLFEFVVKELGYSESQAAERIAAMRLSKQVPEIKKQIETGELSMTTAAQIQRFFRSEKKIVKKEFSAEEKLIIVTECKNQSKREVEKILIEKSETVNAQPREKLRVISSDLTELRFSFSKEAMDKLEKIRNILGLDTPLSDIFEKGLDQLLLAHVKKHTSIRNNKVAPDVGKSASAQNSTPPAKSEMVQSRYIPKMVRNQTHLRSSNRCEYIDPLSSRRCESSYKLQYEHREPFSLGGQATVENIVHFCPAHNQFSAIQQFGNGKMRNFVADLKHR